MSTQIEEQPDIKPDITPPSPCPSPPLREISPRAKSQSIPPPSNAAPTIAPKPQSQPTLSTRFAARTSSGDRQCTNCGEVDTPQWRGTLCNACALWKRSRGTDRPLPLLFPVRKRPRSPTPEEEEEEEPQNQLEITPWVRPGLPSSPLHAQFPVNPLFATRCVSCGQGAEMLVNSRPACGSCVRGMTRNHGSSSPAHLTTMHRVPQMSRAPSSGRSSPYMHGPPIFTHTYGAPTPTSLSVLGTPATAHTGTKLPMAYHTPISPPHKGHLPPHIAAMLPSRTASAEGETRGRKRAATVSGNGSADERAHPTASVHLQPSPPEQRHYEVSPSPPPPRLSSETERDHSSYQRSDNGPQRRPSGARRSTVSGANPILLSLSKEEFMENAEWLYGVLSKTERLLQKLDLEEETEAV